MVIYLDTSALIKLYIKEKGSEEVNNIVTCQNDPLPLCFLHTVELTNAFNLKVFRDELKPSDKDYLVKLFNERKNSGIYYFPQIEISELTQLTLDFSNHTQKLGCRSLDILHVAMAKLLSSDIFVTYDKRQESLAKKVGLKVT